MRTWFVVYILIMFFVILLGYTYVPSYSFGNTADTSANLPSQEFLNLKSNRRFELGFYTIDPIKDEFAEFKSISQKIGFKPKYFLEFISWGDDSSFLSNEYLQYIENLNISPIITWEPWKRDFINPGAVQSKYSLQSIADGSHDEYIEQFALSLKSIPNEVILRFAHEMNTIPGFPVWYPWQGEPDSYKLAFQRIVDIFRENAATNVKFMWNPIYFTEAASPDLYYPGREYVDLIGFTVINLGEITGGKGEDYNWIDCSTLIENQYDNLKKYSKEMFITELLSNEIGGSKSDWYESCFATLKNKPEISTIISVQIDENYEYTHNKVDWRVNSSIESLEEFTRQLRSSN